jgi:hypothetical protein
VKHPMRHTVLAAVLVLALLAGVGCTGRASADPESLGYTLPTRIVVEAGGFLPGSTIQYLGESERGAHVLIDGQEAVKRAGDSLDWRGEPVEGAAVALALRVVSHNADELQLVGTADVEVQDPAPRPAPLVETSPITYNGLVGYGVAAGDQVPGSTMVYRGPADEGAEFGGIEGYPYRRAGDSLVWEGVLREGVYILLELRLVQYDEENVRLAGTVRLWFGE